MRHVHARGTGKAVKAQAKLTSRRNLVQPVGTHAATYCTTVAAVAAVAGFSDFGLVGFVFLGIILSIAISVRFFCEGTVPVVGRPRVPGASAPHTNARDETIFKIGPILYVAFFFVGQAVLNSDK